MFRTELPDNQGMLFSIDPLRNVIFVLEKWNNLGNLPQKTLLRVQVLIDLLDCPFYFQVKS